MEQSAEHSIMVLFSLPTWVEEGTFLLLPSLPPLLVVWHGLNFPVLKSWAVLNLWRKCNNRPEKLLTASSILKHLLGTCMNWQGGFVLEGEVILWIAVHYPKETPCVIHKLLWEQNCQRQNSSTSPYFHSRPRREHHCDLPIRCRIEKETYKNEEKRTK